MMNLIDIIDNCFENDIGDYRVFDFEIVQFIRIILMNDILVNSIYFFVYDVIIVMKYLVEFYKKMIGVVFIDKKKCFKDGQNIISFVIKSIIKFCYEIYCVEIVKFVYLVIMK